MLRAGVQAEGPRGAGRGALGTSMQLSVYLRASDKEESLSSDLGGGRKLAGLGGGRETHRGGGSSGRSEGGYSLGGSGERRRDAAER